MTAAIVVPDAALLDRAVQKFMGAKAVAASGALTFVALGRAHSMVRSNRRTDGWGGTVERRIRFALEVAAATVAEIGADRVGIRLSPGNPLHDIVEDDPHLTYKALLHGLADLGLVYVHVMESPGLRDLTESMRAQWPGAFILNPATLPEPTGPNELALIQDGTADLVSFGGLFLANPDLPARLAAGGPFNSPDRTKSFGGDHRGYTDYPTLN